MYKEIAEGTQVIYPLLTRGGIIMRNYGEVVNHLQDGYYLITGQPHDDFNSLLIGNGNIVHVDDLEIVKDEN